MKNIWIQLFIVIIGILLCIVGYNGVKKYFMNNYVKETNYTLVYNNYSKMSFSPNELEIETEQVDESLIIPEAETTTPTTTTTTTKTTTMTTTTTVKPTEVFETIVATPNISDDGTIIYDGLTLTQLIEKLNKNLNSTLTNTGHFFANYYLKTGLDPYLATAIVLQETGCKWTCSKLVRNCNNVGGMKGTPSCDGGSFKKYDTLESGINGYLDMLYNNYYSQGLTTPELINPKYASSPTWSTNVNNYINAIRES